jgi:hypothetical protein
MDQSNAWTIAITFWFGVPEAAPEPEPVPEPPIDTVIITSVIVAIGFIVKTKLVKKKEE